MVISKENFCCLQTMKSNYCGIIYVLLLILTILELLSNFLWLGYDSHKWGNVLIISPQTSSSIWHYLISYINNIKV